MPFTFYKQPDSMDCGPSCLRMVAKHYGRNLPLQLLRERVQIGKEGVNLLGIAETAEEIGFRSSSVKISYDSLVKEAPLPAILHWDQYHFVVLYKVKRNKLLVADPARGLLAFTASEFKSKWVSSTPGDAEEGIALLLHPSPAFYEHANMTGKRTLQFRNIFHYLLPYKSLLFQLLIGLCVASLLQWFLPFLTQSIVDTGINTANIHFIYIVLAGQLALFAGRIAIEFVRGWILLHISTRINISILTDFLVKLMKLPVSFFDSKHTGDILQRMNDHTRIQSFLTGSSLNVLFSLINLVVFAMTLAVFNGSIFIVFSIATLLYAVWVKLFMQRRQMLDHKRFEVAAKEQAIAIQLVQGMQEIKLNGAERPMRWGWERMQVRLFRLSIKSLSLSQWQQAGGLFINEGKNILITFLSARAVIDGQMTLGAMLAVQYIIGQLNSPVEQMIGFAQSWQDARISMDRLNEIHNMEDEEHAGKYLQKELPAAFQRQVTGGRSIEPVDDRIVSTRSHVHIEEHFSRAAASRKNGSLHRETPAAASDKAMLVFDKVSFTYPGAGNEAVLKDITLHIPKGKTTAIVGSSGSGKTTLLKLLLKFYEPQQGEIRLGTAPLSNISHRVWRSCCGVVMQESFIFSDTIARNIVVGEERIDPEKLQHASVVANIREFIDSLPLGYNTRIGAEGTGISMGQKQRILIARSVYRDPDFIFFDEATNSLDANNESRIIRNLASFFKGRTVLVVAHRLSTVRHADQIVVLNKGRIIEKGTHSELTELKGEYYQLVKNQLELDS